jgi:archaellum component FlaC
MDMIVENMKNRIENMVMDSEIVYVDGMTIKDRDEEPTHPNVKDVMEHINKYYITSFNRDGSKGKRYLELHSEYVL